MYKDVKTAYKSDKFGNEHYEKLRRNKLIRGLHASLKEKRAAYEEADFLSKDFQTNQKLFDKYLKKAHAKDAREMGYDSNNMSIIRDAADRYQDITMDAYVGGKAFRMYLKDKGVDPKKYMQNARKAYNDYMNECCILTRKMLGDMGNMPVNGTYVNGTHNEKYATAVTDALINSAQKDWERNYLYAIGYNF